MTEKSTFFSVIIPAHNSAAYIRKLLDSIAEQSFTNYELIVVCDSCTDNTAEIAREYTDCVFEVDYKRDGLTRNCGLDHASGEWVLFADDDDWFLHEFAFQMLHDVLEGSTADILAFSFIWKDIGYAQNRSEKLWVSVWNKAWKRSFIGETRFSDREWASDEYFNNAMLAKKPLIAIWDMPFYYYNFMREGSLTFQNANRLREQNSTGDDVNLER